MRYRSSSIFDRASSVAYFSSSVPLADAFRYAFVCSAVMRS
ncbi:hypothetical protein ACH4F6_36990 [Streptomyces sp. NPDC017936]